MVGGEEERGERAQGLVVKGGGGGFAGEKNGGEGRKGRRR